VHASAADSLYDVEDAFTVVEHVKNGGQGADILGKSAVPDEMARDAEELRHHDANDLHTVGDIDPSQLLHGKNIRQVVHHAAEIVDAIGVGNVRMPGLPLTHFLRTSMVKADLRHRVDDFFPVELEDDSQHAMRAGMLGPYVEKHEVRAFAGTLEPPFFRPEAECFLFLVLLVVRQLKRPHFRSPRRMLLAQRMPLPGGRHQNSSEIRMPLEFHTEHVPHLALVPVGARPEIRHGGDGGGRFRQGDLETKVLVSPVGEKMIQNGKIARGLIFAMRAEALVDSSQVVECFEWSVDLRFEEAQKARNVGFRDPQRGKIGTCFFGNKGAGAKACFELAQNRGVVTHYRSVRSHRVRLGFNRQISSGDLSTVVRERSALLRSLMEGSDARTTPCGPTTQLRGRRSFPTCLCSSVSPSMKA